MAVTANDTTVALQHKSKNVMKKIYLSAMAIMGALSVSAQIQFDPKIDPIYVTSEVVVPASPLIMQHLFIGSTHLVQTNATYGNPAGAYPAKEWHDFIGFTPDQTGNSLGWVTVNHEMIVQDDHIGDGGGMTAFRVTRDTANDTLIIMDQTLSDGRSGKFFAIDFVNTVGETGMNCGGITSSFDGRIWTAEEWFRTSNTSISDRDTSDFIIGTGTVNGQTVTNGFPGFDGITLKKFENVNWMVEVDPREAVAIRKQYNWGRMGFEGGAILPDNKTVFIGEDATPGWLAKFVADTPGDFTSGDLFLYKENGGSSKWVQIDNTDMDVMLNISDAAQAAGATMFNRVEWVVYDQGTNAIYFTETGNDKPGNSWRDESIAGATHSSISLARGVSQGTHPDSTDYEDYYGRVIKLNLSNDNISSFIEGGPDLPNGTGIGAYPDVHLSNPDGLGFITVGSKTYLLINEDLNGSTFGRMPSEITNRTCELFLLDLDIASPTWSDLVRIAVVPSGAEVTGATATPDGKTILLNSQHPSSSNPFPYNHSLTIALTGWDKLKPADIEYVPLGVEETETSSFSVFPNPTTRIVHFNGKQDVALYDMNGRRIRVARQVSSLDIVDLEKGIYFIQNGEGETKRLILQ
jgi:secreted PhoX family phosphatase